MRSQLRTARSGQLIAGRYRLRGPLGRGAMGTVWRAEHLQLRSPVAIKFLDRAIAQDPEMAERFMREAQSAAAVRSTHVVQIFDYGVEDAPYGTLSVAVGGASVSASANASVAHGPIGRIRKASLPAVANAPDSPNGDLSSSSGISSANLSAAQLFAANLSAANQLGAAPHVGGSHVAVTEPEPASARAGAAGVVDFVGTRTSGANGKRETQGTPYIVMELLNGESLEARLTRGTLQPFELDKVFSEVARAVNNAHDLGVVHRDLTPSNIFLAREGKDEVTKVLDFGIAKMQLDTPGLGDASATRSGIFMGTPRYMSPEQVRSTRDVDHATDLWSLGIVAFECLTGRCPFVGETAGELVVQICTSEPLVPSEVADVPAGFDAWFLKSTSKEKGDRFASAREMADALHLVLEHAPRLAPNEGRATVRQPAAQQALVLVSELRVRALDAWYRLQRTVRGGVVVPLCVAAVAAVALGGYALPKPRAEPVQVPIIYREPARLTPRSERPGDPSASASPAPEQAALRHAELGGVETGALPRGNEELLQAPRVAPAEVDVASDDPTDLQRALASGAPRARSKHKARPVSARPRKPATGTPRPLPDVPAVSPEARRPPPAVADRPSPRLSRDPF
jgi:serine/threonine protein kinase